MYSFQASTDVNAKLNADIRCELPLKVCSHQMTATITVTFMGGTFDLSDRHCDRQNFTRQCNVCYVTVTKSLGVNKPLSVSVRCPQ